MPNQMKEIRESLGLTAKDVANAIKVHENAVLRWESGKADPLSSNLVKLAALYGCTVEDLLGLTTSSCDLHEGGTHA